VSQNNGDRPHATAQGNDTDFDVIVVDVDGVIHIGLYAEQARTAKVDLRGLSLYLREFCVRELRQGLLNLADRIQAKSLRRLYLLLKRIGAWQSQRSGDR